MKILYSGLSRPWYTYTAHIAVCVSKLCIHKQGETIIYNIMCITRHQSEYQNTIMIHESTVCDGFISPN